MSQNITIYSDNSQYAFDDDPTNNPDAYLPFLTGTPLLFSKPSSDQIDFIRGPLNHVKLYVLCNQRVWDDRGTGHVACMPASDGSDAMCIVVRLEAGEYENKVLESWILLDTIYQKQQGTFIVWSETETCDLALSFQEKAGCAEIWDKICRIQGKDPDAEEENECEEQEPSDSSTSGISSGACGTAVSLPPCEFCTLAELKSALSDGIFLSTQREKLAGDVIQKEYVPKLCDLFQICEDLDDLDRLGQLYHIAKSLFLLNSNSLLSELLDEKYFKDIVGMLEYDPAEPKKKHREFLWEKSKFREILPIQSDELKAKIHQTYRVQYVLDVCLPAPSLFEENLLTVLSSHLFFNRAEIVASLLNDKNLMKQLFEELKDPEISAVRQRDLTNFLKEFCSFAHSLQPNGPQGREQFFKTLMTNDVLSTIDPCISSTLSSTRVATVELLTMIVDFEPKAVRDFFVGQFHNIPPTRDDDLLINKLIKHMLSDNDPEQTAAIQMSNALRILLDPENIGDEETEFLPLFYKRAMHSLCQPIFDNAKDGVPIRDDYHTANQLALVIDLFCFFVDHHNYSMRAFTTQKNLLGAVLIYLKSRHHFLVLCALRMCRRILNLNDLTYTKYKLDRGIIKQIVDCFVANGPRYNLLNSAIIEFFEFIRMENMRSVIEYVVENHWDVFGSITYVRTFSAIKIRYDQLEAGRAASVRSSLSRDSSNGSATPTRAASVEQDGGETRIKMFTVEEMDQLIIEARALHAATVAETNRLNLLTGSTSVNTHNVQLPTKDPDLMAMFREETKRQEERSRKKLHTPLSAKENTADEDRLLAGVNDLTIEDDDESDEDPMEDERYKQFDAENFLKKYFKIDAIRPVNSVEPSPLPYRHDHLRRMEQYREQWAQNPAPGDRSRRAERSTIRQRMADKDPMEDERMKKKNALRPVNAVEPGRLPYRHDHLRRMEQYREQWAQNPAPGDRSRRAERSTIRQRMADKDPMEDERMKKKNALRPVNAVEPGRLPYRHDHLRRMEQYREEWAQNPAPGDRSWRAERWTIRQRMADKDPMEDERVKKKLADTEKKLADTEKKLADTERELEAIKRELEAIKKKFIGI